MGRTRTPQTSLAASTGNEAETAAAAALVQNTGATRATFVSLVAPTLLPFVPPATLSIPALAAEIAATVAGMLHKLPAIPVAAVEGFMKTVAIEALLYRVEYAKAAVRRLSGRVTASKESDGVAALREAWEGEERHLRAHSEMTRRRMAAGQVAEGMMELFGSPVLGWKHASTRIPTDPRPSHEAADGQNVDLRRGVPVSTGALPGVLPGCTCSLVAPFEGARTLI